jgi:hypothetical protein
LNFILQITLDRLASSERNDAATTNNYESNSPQRFEHLELDFHFSCVIAKLTNELRLGHTNFTWYRLTDEHITKCSSHWGRNTTETLPAADVVSPDELMFKEPYKLQTPSKTTFSLAYAFGVLFNKVLITAMKKIKESTAFKPKMTPILCGS